MNIHPICCNYTNTNSNSVNITNRNVSIGVRKTTCYNNTSPTFGDGLSLFTKIFMSKKNIINLYSYDLEKSFENSFAHHKSISQFNESKDIILEIVEKDSKNAKYTNFINKSLAFLSENFEQCKEGKDLRQLMVAIRVTAVAAINKNQKEIDTKIIQQHIERANNIMQNTDNLLLMP